MGAEGLGGSGRAVPAAWWHRSITQDPLALSPCSQQPLVTLTPPLCPSVRPSVSPQATRTPAEPLPPAPGTGMGPGTRSSSDGGRWEASPGADPAPGRLQGGRRRRGGSPKPTSNLPAAGRTEGSRAVRLSSPPCVLLRGKSRPPAVSPGPPAVSPGPPAVFPGPPARCCWLGHGSAGAEICPKLGEGHWVGGSGGGMRRGRVPGEASAGPSLARGDRHSQLGQMRTFIASFVLVSFCFN